MTLKKDSVTAVVGVSGSGKTTLLKLLLGFYPPASGEIRVGDMNLKMMSPDLWRDQCGVVMQDGYLFSDTIASNIALGEESINTDQLLYAARMACIDDFIDRLPLGYNTRIGQEGLTLSGGEEQRILIARAIYKNPGFLFLDEGTSALDANNETEDHGEPATGLQGKNSPDHRPQAEYGQKCRPDHCTGSGPHCGRG